MEAKYHHQGATIIPSECKLDLETTRQPHHISWINTLLDAPQLVQILPKYQLHRGVVQRVIWVPRPIQNGLLTVRYGCPHDVRLTLPDGVEEEVVEVGGGPGVLEAGRE